MADQEVNSTYSFEVQSYVHVVEFCPFEQSSQLVAYGGNNRVSVAKCVFPEEDKELGDLEYEHLRDFHHGTRVDAIAWSPQTNINTLPRVVRFCTAGSDRKIRIFSSDLKEKDSIQVLEGHTDYVNDVVFEPTNGEQVASVSDDHTCRVWDLDGTQKAVMPLKGQGVSVRWHPEDPGKLMVAEKTGIIRFYDIITCQPIMSLDCGHAPLTSADWCRTDPLTVGAVAGSDWFMWDVTRSSRPEDRRQVHPEGAKNFRWCRVSEKLFATCGRPGNQVKVFHKGHHQTPVSSSMMVQGGLSWHARLPVCAVGGDRVVHMWLAEL
ncbi:nucleoporin Nup37-like [Branchiostoma floridae x Branchiostoma japonicum]